MPDKGLRPGFRFPMRVGAFGIPLKNFRVARVGNNYAAPGFGSSPLTQAMFAGVQTGTCRVEVLPASANPMNEDTADALFIADGVDLQWAQHQTVPAPFMILTSQHFDSLMEALKSFEGKDIHLRFTPMADVKIIQPDPDNEGWTLGWGVYRNAPWDFRGLHNSKEEATEAAAKLGPDYEVAYGTNENDTDNFVTVGF